jgi:hypothetical protein
MLFYINYSHRKDEELKKLILFDILKSKDMIILFYDFEKRAFYKYRDPKLSFIELSRKVLAN